MEMKLETSPAQKTLLNLWDLCEVTQTDAKGWKKKMLGMRH